jgi:RimJ/RimL family protein N-acetyltransferase
MVGAKLLEGELVFLDALERSDVETFAPWWRNLDLVRFLAQDAALPQTPEDELEWFEKVRKDEGTFLFAVRRRDTGALVGTASLFDINWRVRKCVFGIALGPPEIWGKGFGSEATRLTLRYAFSELNLNRVQLFVYEFNERAVRAYKKVGFQKEGRLREAVYRDGRYYDEFVMACLRSEWSESAGVKDAST